MIQRLSKAGLRLHGFGLKTRGLAELGPLLESADSLAWSLNARKNPGIAGHAHKSCANCFDYAMDWRERLLGRQAEAAQVPLFE